MLRRTPLGRGSKPLRRLTRLHTRSKTNSYRQRERDIPYMLWVKRQPCIVRELPPTRFISPFAGPRYLQAEETQCWGCVEADHAGERGIGQKADDRTCIPLCRQHHGERTNHKGPFFYMTRDELRAWRARAIERTQAAWSNT